MQKRRVSPIIIATPLIIVLTVALAATVVTWGGTFMGKTSEETERASRTTQKCSSDLDFKIVSIDLQNNKIKVENDGRVVDTKKPALRIHKSARITTEEINEELRVFETKSFYVSDVRYVDATATILGEAGTDMSCNNPVQEFVIKSTGEGHYCCAVCEPRTEYNEYGKDCPGERSRRSTFAEVVNGEIWMNGKHIRMAGEGCYELISCVFTGWDDPYRILDVFRTLAGEKIIYIRASFSGPHDEGPEYVLPVWRDDRERYLSVLKDIIDYAKSKNIYIVADLNHEVHGWFENEVGEPDGAILNTSSRSYALYMEYVTSIVGRFKDEPYILAWETINEPNLIPEWGSNGVEFCRQVYQSIKAVDSNHMVFHGFDGPGISRTTLDAIGTDHMDALCSHSYNQWVYRVYGGYSCSLTDERREAAWDAYFSELNSARIDYNLPVINTEIGSVCPEHIMGDPNNTGPESPNCPKLWNLIWSKFKQYDIDMMNGWAFIWGSEDWKKTTYYQELKETIFDVNPLPSDVDVPSNGKSLIFDLFQNYPNGFNTVANIK